MERSALKAPEQKARFDPRRITPYQVILVALLMAFFAFFMLFQSGSWPPQWYAAHPYLIHFVRGFVATTAGMLVVFWVMHCKEQELAELRRQYNTQLDRYQVDSKNHQAALFEQREDFGNLISHRLKTPIQALDRAVVLIKDGDFGPVDAGQSEILNLMAQNIEDLSRLLDMTVDICRYRNSTKELNRHPYDLSKLLAATAGAYAGKAEQKGIALVLDHGMQECSVSCDEAAMRTLVFHLVDNAIKYGRSQVRLSLHCDAETKQATICVEDDGAGIPLADQEDLFDRFHTMSASGTYAPVTGAGLCLCAEIARAHGGTIVCQSRPTQGTKFSVMLPAFC